MPIQSNQTTRLSARISEKAPTQCAETVLAAAQQNTSNHHMWRCMQGVGHQHDEPAAMA
jgi:hypothetical protein